MFQIRIGSIWEISFVRNAHKFVFPGPFRSVPVFTNSNLGYIKVNSDDSKVRYFMFLLPFKSGPRFLLGYKSGCRPFRVRSGPFRYFHTQTSNVFNSVLVHFNDWYLRIFFFFFLFLMRIWSVSDFPFVTKVY